MGLIFSALGNAVFIVRRGYVKHATRSYPNRRARMETDASPSHSYLGDLQTTARQSVHVEKGVPGCYGKVGRFGVLHTGILRPMQISFYLLASFSWMCFSVALANDSVDHGILRGRVGGAISAFLLLEKK